MCVAILQVPKFKLVTGAFFGHEWREGEVLCPLHEMSLEAVQQYREYWQKVVKERSMDKLKVRIAREFVPPGNVIWMEKRKVVPPAAAAAGQGNSVASSSALPQGDGLPHHNAKEQQQCSKVSLPLHLRLLQMLRGGRRREDDGVVINAHGAGVTAREAGAGAQQEQQQQLVDMLGSGAVAAAAAAAGTGPEDEKGEQGQVSGQRELSTSSTAAAVGAAVPICVSNGEVNGSNMGVEHAAGEQTAAAERERGDGEVVSTSLQQQQQGEEEGVLLPGALIASSRARALSIGRRAAMMRLIPHCSDGVSLIAGGMVVSRSMFMDHVPDLQLANLKKVRSGMIIEWDEGCCRIVDLAGHIYKWRFFLASKKLSLLS